MFMFLFIYVLINVLFVNERGWRYVKKKFFVFHVNIAKWKTKKRAEEMKSNNIHFIHHA